jgi:hypothetical protein
MITHHSACVECRDEHFPTCDIVTCVKATHETSTTTTTTKGSA